MAWGRVLLNIGIGLEGNLDASPTSILEDGGESILREELSLKTFHWIMSHSGIGVGATFRSSHSLRYMFIQRLDRTLATIQAQVIVLFELCAHGVCGYWVPAGLRPSSAKALA